MEILHLPKIHMAGNTCLRGTIEEAAPGSVPDSPGMVRVRPSAFDRRQKPGLWYVPGVPADLFDDDSAPWPVPSDLILSSSMISDGLLSQLVSAGLTC